MTKNGVKIGLGALPPARGLMPVETPVNDNNGAGEGNRTLVCSLEGCRSTIELHPRPHSNSEPPSWASADERNHSRPLELVNPACAVRTNALAFPILTVYRFRPANNRRTREVAGDKLMFHRVR